MLKFTLASRHKDDGTRERFFYEWSIIHVALMLTTPTHQKIFKRYAQHFNIPGVTNDMVIHPFSDQNWESFADHWVESYEDVITSIHNKDYVERMQPHRFGSDKFITSVSNFETIYEQEGFRSGGVKLITFLRKKPGMPQEEFNKKFSGNHASVMRDLIRGKKLARKYVQNIPAPCDPAIFKGTLFELGQIDLYAGMEEFWFDSVEALARLRLDQQVYDAIRASEEGFVQADGSISMVVNERVVWDAVTPGERTPSAAILDPASREAVIDRQDYGDFDKRYIFTIPPVK
jgi:hypothetical protein